MFNNFKNLAKNFAKAKKEYNDSFYFFANYLTVEYESMSTLEYSNGDTGAHVFVGNAKLHEIANAIATAGKTDSIDDIC